MRTAAAALTAIFACAGSVFASFDDALDRVGDALSFSTPGGGFHLDVSGTAEAEAYSLTLPYEGTLYTDDSRLGSGRLTTWIDAQLGSHIYLFSEVRFDRGFDPGKNHRPRARIDVCAARLSLGSLVVQAGKFATVTGSWPRRYASWENAFVTAPLPYSHLTGIWESHPAGSPATLLRWGHVRPRPDAYDEQSDQDLRQPIVWGPAYGTGAAAFWQSGPLRLAAEVKNSALSSSPYRWNPNREDWDNPAFAARFAWKPGPVWELGFSASTGTYLEPDAAYELPAGRGLSDYRQTTWGADLGFARHHWQVWAEAIVARFDLPGHDPADVFSWYLESRYKLTARFSLGARVGQQLYGTVTAARNEKIRWGRNTTALELAPVFRFNAHLQAKAQFSLLHTESSGRRFGRLVAGQLALRF